MNAQYFEEIALPMPLTQSAFAIADRFAAAQPSGSKRDQVRHNTLAVQVVADYLHLMGIATAVSDGDSWNAVTQLCSNVADLVIPGVGRLECRPVTDFPADCYIPADVWHDRIGYVVVHLDLDVKQEGLILGFVPAVTQENLPLSQLGTIDDLLSHLFALRTQSVTETQTSSTMAQASLERTKLTQWLDQLDQWVDRGWQAIEQLLSPAQLAPAYAVRHDPQDPDTVEFVTQAKRLDWQRGDIPVIFIAGVAELPEAVRIRIQVFAIEPTSNLPQDLRLQVLDEMGHVFLETVSGHHDRGLQLVFEGERGEVFAVQLGYQGEMIVEHFEI
ncbi:DUF1822 family protein [Alkalinema sp. FACHB-956]|uniref:DUF1822 family protein n=1 Tax=Alkalinema sp. FACHB-956 TaxID=2692768 RepID=UPI001684AF80|nr:DUF1822 family protein [Alkalinema sp. FACHB-956]MBD2325777.1 DUF1822 family protein [Alkalinema sp. FACHB-956]